MSAAAEKRVRECTDPRVTEIARTLMDVIAKLIPEGETTTPLIGMGDLATRAHLHRRTVCTWVPVLVEIGEVAIVDGGQGRQARYTLVHVAGAGPITSVPLPLIGATPRRSPARSDPTPPPPNLFDPPLERGTPEEVVNPHDHKDHKLADPAITRITRITSWAVRTITRITRITRITSWARSNSEELVIGTCDPRPSVRSDGEELVQLVIGTCDPAPTYVRTTTTTGTTTSARGVDKPNAVEPTPPPLCRWHGTRHAWCDFRGQHVPMLLHQELRRKLARQPGQTDADLDAILGARYAAIARAVPDTQDLDLTENGFEFWKRMLRAAAIASTPTTVEPDEFAQAAEERRQRWGGKS